MIEEKVYISFREKGTEEPWQLLRVTDPRKHFSTDPSDPFAVNFGNAPLYLEKLAERGYETIVIQLHPETGGAYIVNELEILAELFNIKI